MAAATLRIGCGGGFWGDSEEGPVQLVTLGAIDVLVIDYLAEITMALLGRLKARDPQAGYVPDFVTLMGSLAGDIHARGIKVVVNAGGLNPQGCRDALVAELARVGVPLRVAAIVGDDLTPLLPELRAAGVADMESGVEIPDKVLSANAYLGAFPIAAALSAGADIVVTGRCVDSALALGPLIHAFGWTESDLDLLAQGSLAGHIIECGTQATGGIVTDWELVEGWDRMGFPIAECSADGSFIVTKPAGTGGRVTPETIAEQIVYEVGDPTAYLLPDVTCDFSQVRLAQDGPDRVRVTGARGRPATAQCKASITYADGYKAVGMLMIGGRDAAAKARRTAEALLARTSRMLSERGLAGYARVSTEVLGAEATYGPHGRASASREVILKLAVQHERKEGAELLSREFLASATAMAQGITGFAGGRPKVSPVIRLLSCLVDKALLSPRLLFEGDEISFAMAAGEDTAVLSGAPSTKGTTRRVAPPAAGPRIGVPLAALALARSGDKGDSVNIGVIARRAEFLPLLEEVLTAEVVAGYFAHLASGPVTRFPWPGLGGFNFVLKAALDGGGIASLRHDPQGKAFAQMLLDIEVAVPEAWIGTGGLIAAEAVREIAA